MIYGWGVGGKAVGGTREITIDWVKEEGKGKIGRYEKGREENVATLLNHKRALSPGIWKMNKHPRAGWKVLVKYSR